MCAIDSVYMHSIIMREECHGYLKTVDGVDSSDSDLLESLSDLVYGALFGPMGEHSDEHFIFRNSIHVGPSGEANGGDSGRSEATETILSERMKKVHCERYFRRVLSRRYLHMSSVLNDHAATSEIASLLASYQGSPFDPLNISTIGLDSGPNGGTGPGGDTEQVLKLYAFNAMRGDIHSFISLGWMFRSGADGMFLILKCNHELITYLIFDLRFIV